MTTTGIPAIDFYSAVSSALAPVAPSFEDEKNVERRDPAKRFVWVWDEVKTDESSYAMLDDTFQFLIHCWGASKAEAFRLRQGLITAAWEAVGGQNIEVVRTTFKGGDANLSQGWVCIVELHATFPLFEAEIRNGEIVDAEGTETVRADEYQFDPEGATDDGYLEAGEDAP